MAKVLRVTGAIVAGIVVALLLAIAVEVFSAIVHPTPPDFTGSMEEMCEHVARYPPWVLAVAVPMWAGSALVSTWLAGRIGNLASAVVVGLLLLLAVGSNVSMLPYPTWFKAACVVTIPVAIGLGIYASRRRLPSTRGVTEGMVEAT